MKTMYVILLAACMFFMGCVHLSATLPDGSQIDYTRIGNQELSGVVREADGSILIETQKSDNAELYGAINKLVDKVP